MKILITTDWYKPVINGVVTSVLNLVDGLEKDGHEVRVLTLANSVRGKKEGNVYYIGSISAGMVYPNARLRIRKNKKYFREIIEWKPDVIHSQCEFSTFFAAKKISARTGAPIVHTYHTVYEGYTHYFCPNKRVGKKIVQVFSRKIANRTQAFIVPSEKIYDMLEDYRISVPQYVVPSGIELDQFMQDHTDRRAQLRRELGIAEYEKILINIGRIAREKNLDEIVRYLKESDMPGIRMLIVGDGPYRTALEEYVREIGMEDRVIFTGMVQPSQVAEYYSVGDIFVSGSTSETQGLTYMEAMASGLTPLCREDACLKGVIVPGKNGYTYRDQEDFHKKLFLLINHDNLRKQLGVNARQSIREHYSIPAFAGACEEIYRKYASGEESQQEQHAS